MSRTFGEIRQIAFVVEAPDAAMDYWAHGLGSGPFFVKRRIALSDYVYRGEAAESPRISIALANSGPLQVELIQQHDDRPSIYRELADLLEPAHCARIAGIAEAGATWAGSGHLLEVAA